MAITLPYLPSNKNVEVLFGKIAAAKVPDAFTHNFLNKTLGLKSTNDRALIPLLRTLGYIDASGKPTGEYSELKNQGKAKKTMAAAIRRAYQPLFEANETAHKLSSDDLKGLVAQVAGTDQDMTGRIVGTFNALAKVADFSSSKIEEENLPEDKPPKSKAVKETLPQGGLRPEFHYNIQVHLPSNATEEVYLNIFNALRRAFQ